MKRYTPSVMRPRFRRSVNYFCASAAFMITQPRMRGQLARYVEVSPGGKRSALPDIEAADACNSQTFATLALLLWRCRAILILFLASLEKCLKLTSKLWVQFLESN